MTVTKAHEFSRVDFAYAFATPHRITAALPDSGDKTLLDLQPGSLRMAWTYDSLASMAYGPFLAPRTSWELQIQPELDGQPFSRSTWTRLEGRLPALDNRYADARGSVRLEVVGAREAALVRITLENTGDQPHRFSLYLERPGNLTGYNPHFVDADEPANLLLAGWQDRADRLLVHGLGAQTYEAPKATALRMAWMLLPGETIQAWLVRPYRAYGVDRAALEAVDWQRAFDEGLQVWRDLLARMVEIQVSDEGVRNGFYASAADLFVMREPTLTGQLTATPGTEGYRAGNPFEPAILSVALDQIGLSEEAPRGADVMLEAQEENGDWSEPKGWSHFMWGASGVKCWAIMVHYQITRDRDYLVKMYPRMRASARWQESQRVRTRVLEDGERPLTYGLMPRGMGDCGLMDGDSYYGVFIPHNILAVYADRTALEAARILGRSDDVAELERIYETGYNDLMHAMERGAITEDGFRWIPGVPGKTCGSRWGTLYALYPCALLAADHELISGTIRKMEARMSPGGQPVHTGWMEDGMWVAITLDCLAEAHLARDEGDAAAEYLYSTLNHGTPLVTWCEERGQAAGTEKTSGDRQHLWTPLAVVRCLRDMLVMEDADGLHLARGVARGWLASGEPVGIVDAPTHFGKVSYTLRYDAQAGQVTGSIQATPGEALRHVTLHVRLPGGLRLTSVEGDGNPQMLPDGAGLRWMAPVGEMAFAARVKGKG
ncbi:MAG: hypothetical protein ACYC5M_10765 [Anaerolineae bacterium]